MSKVNLHPYSITIREKRSKEDQNINNLFGTNKSLFDLISNAISTYNRKPFLEKSSKKALKFEKSPLITKDEEMDILQSLVYYGEYGIIRKIMDTNTGEIDEKSIDREKTPVFDLTFSYFQDKLIENKAYLIAQTYSRNGYKTILTEMLKKELNEMLIQELDSESGVDATISINPLVSRELVDIMTHGDRITEIELISHDISKDNASKILSTTGNDTTNNHELIKIDDLNSVNLSITSSKNGSLVPYSKVKELTTSLKQMILNSKDTVFYEVTNSEMKGVKVTVTTPLREFIVKIDSDDLKFRESYPLKDDDVIKKDGSIAHNYVMSEAREYAASVARKYRQI
ncbi:hypothetical protein MettiDRAFT_1695 [Methanolobus tindarius DSM 2278]|uniref:Uncharacterized protein n=1 Tax=Methanolobus tindarius DSM 2278 TaxID=1090322 RepID=W9DXV0_METTI|nr:hypothetical protein [Methanolobus tindarius]ETA68241.1 hypothetical protein MettiDRAFT_1695 [Methanolobus tindarius DSM 2278]